MAAYLSFVAEVEDWEAVEDVLDSLVSLLQPGSTTRHQVLKTDQLCLCSQRLRRFLSVQRFTPQRPEFPGSDCDLRAGWHQYALATPAAQVSRRTRIGALSHAHTISTACATVFA